MQSCFKVQILDLPSQDLEKIKAEYTEEVEALVLQQSIWNDVTTYFLSSEK